MANGEISPDKLKVKVPKIKLDEFEIYYESHGAGAPLVLIPGFNSGAWTWYRQTDILAKDFRVITFDPRGVAQSKIADCLAHTVSVKQIAADIADLLDRLEIEKANVLGASFGGFVAQEFALEFPEKLDKLILVCTSAGGTNHIAADIEVLRSFRLSGGADFSERIRKFMQPAFTERYAETNFEEIEKVCRLREENFVPETVHLAQLEAAFTFDAASRVECIRAETLILTGDKDSVVPMQNSINLSELIPNAQLKIIENGSHLFFIEKADEFNQTIVNFLKGESV